MYSLNLLPWRQQRRRERQRRFVALLGLTAIGAFLLVLLGSWWMGSQVNGQQSRNQYLQNEIRKLDVQITEIDNLEEERTRLLSRKAVIEELQVSRTLMVHLFDQLSRTVPEGLRLTKVAQKGQILTLEGMTQSNARVSSYLRKLEGSDWLHNPELIIIEVDEADGTADQPYTFKVSARLASPQQVAQEEQQTTQTLEVADGSTP